MFASLSGGACKHVRKYRMDRALMHVEDVAPVRRAHSGRSRRQWLAANTKLRRAIGGADVSDGSAIQSMQVDQHLAGRTRL